MVFSSSCWSMVLKSTIGLPSALMFSVFLMEFAAASTHSLWPPSEL